MTRNRLEQDGFTFGTELVSFNSPDEIMYCEDVSLAIYAEYIEYNGIKEFFDCERDIDYSAYILLIKYISRRQNEHSN